MPKRVKSPFVGQLYGREVIVTPDDIYADDHEIVVAYPHLFEEIPVIPRRGEVEQATAAPGELRRGPGRPRKHIADL